MTKKIMKAIQSVIVTGAVALLIQTPTSGQLASQPEEARLQENYPGYRGVDGDYRHAGEAALERWQDWKWGLRIHWGLYAMYDSRESWIIRDHKDDTNWLMNYYASYQRFNPTNFNADRWMEIMQRAGMKYFSFTSKHHEGFCLWPTKTLQRGFCKNADGTFTEVTNHFSTAETPFARDLIGELAKSARAHQLGVSLYYSHIDWHDWDFGWDNQFGCRNFWYDGTFTKKSDDPARWAAFIQKERDQITELLTSYGPIDTLCLDMSWTREAQEDCYGIAKLARQLQPNIMLRNRGIGAYGDYETPERQIPEDPNKVNRPWQVIYPGGNNFSYSQNDTYKPREWVLESLLDTVAKGGNFQVGFGPDPTGAWPTQMIERVSYVGDWLKVNGEAIYATRPYLRYHESKDLRFTRTKDKKFLYVISLKWPGTVLESTLARAKEGSAIRLIGYNHDLKWQQTAGQLTIQMPEELQDETKRPCQQAYVFKVESQPWDKVADSPPNESSK
jgi:alpha-L-fucosidase